MRDHTRGAGHMARSCAVEEMTDERRAMCAVEEMTDERRAMCATESRFFFVRPSNLGITDVLAIGPHHH